MFNIYIHFFGYDRSNTLFLSFYFLNQTFISIALSIIYFLI